MSDVSFAVSPEVPPPKRLEQVDYRRELRVALRRPIEAIWQSERPLVKCDEHHALLTALEFAFYDHCPLTLSPDVIWITVARNFALHVNLHAEELRGRFVTHAGKEQLRVDRPDFLPGQANPWPEAFASFGEQISSRTGGLDALVRADFSTTGAVEQAVSCLMVMETFQSYFEYEFRGGCGIPAIRLTGTVADWERVRARAAKFANYGLQAWIAALDPVLEQFVGAASGAPDIDFWKSLFRYHSGSGPAVLTGWANVFFPYLKEWNRRGEHLISNPYLKDWRERLEIDERQHWQERSAAPQGCGLESFPTCQTAVPLKVLWGDRETDMRLVGGLLGVSQAEQTFAVQPECGWVLAYEEPVDPLSPRHARREARLRD